MKLLLDEHLAPAIAHALRDRGHDVIAVAERPDLRGRPDPDLLAMAGRDRRVLVTENPRDFAVLGARRLPDGHRHHGIIMLSPRTFPRSAVTIGSVALALACVLAEDPTDDALVGQVVWLQRRESDGS